MADCRSCKRLKRRDLLDFSRDCKGFEFYEPGDITFCPIQIVWLTKNLSVLHEYHWPVEVDGQVKIPRRKKPSGGGYFETPADFAFEVERRLEYCGLDGLLVYLYYGFEFEGRELSKFYRLGSADIERRIEAVIWWISGWNFYTDRPYRRWLVYRDYANWKSQRDVKVA